MPEVRQQPTTGSRPFVTHLRLFNYVAYRTLPTATLQGKFGPPAESLYMLERDIQPSNIRLDELTERPLASGVGSELFCVEEGTDINSGADTAAHNGSHIPPIRAAGVGAEAAAEDGIGTATNDGSLAAPLWGSGAETIAGSDAVQHTDR